MGAGEPSEVPLFGKKTKEAINTLLSQRLPRIEETQNAGSEECEILTKALCSDFRIIMERVVETILLADVVQRHRRAINTKGKLKDLAKINEKDCAFIDQIMTKYSCYEHSQSLEAPGTLLPPNDLKKDINDVLIWHNEFSKRCTSIEVQA